MKNIIVTLKFPNATVNATLATTARGNRIKKVQTFNSEGKNFFFPVRMAQELLLRHIAANMQEAELARRTIDTKDGMDEVLEDLTIVLLAKEAKR